VLVRLTVLSVSYSLARVSPGTAGGAEQVLLTIDKALVQKGHRSVVLASKGSRCHGLLISARIPSGVLDEAAKNEARQVFKHLIDRTLAHYSVDVIHMHGIDFAEYLPDADIPIVVSLHLPLRWYSQYVLKRSAKNISFVCVSHHQAQTAPPGFHCERVIPNGVDLDQRRPARRTGNYVLAMGRICPEKAFHLAIEAAERAEQNLIIGGTVFEYPEHRAYFDSQIAPRLNDRIRFIGPVGGERKAQLLAGAKCLLIPSQVAETSSLLAMEAIASGTPVIAWRSGALPEVVADRRTGFIVSSVEEMVYAISCIGQIDRRECRREAKKRFDARRMASKYLELYEHVGSRSFLPELQAA
jgi:glycosyltransferase involved in cell wall biosynthesis